MFLYNSENPKIVSTGTRVWDLSFLTEDKNYFIGYDNGDSFYVKNVITNTVLYDQKMVIGTNSDLFKYLNGPYNLDIKTASFSGDNFIAVSRRIISGNTLTVHNTIYKINSTNITIEWEEIRNDSVAFPSGSNHETTSSIVEYKNGFSFFGMSSHETLNRPDQVASGAFQALSAVKYTIMEIKVDSVDINNNFNVIRTVDDKLGGIIGDISYVRSSGTQSWCRMNYEKKLGNFFTNRNSFISAGNKLPYFSISYLLRHKIKEGFHNGSSGVVREYGTVSSSINGVFKINDNGSSQFVKPFQLFSYVNNMNTIPSDSLFTSFAFDDGLKNTHTLWDEEISVVYITGSNAADYHKVFYDHIYNDYSTLIPRYRPSVRTRLAWYTGNYKYKRSKKDRGYGSSGTTAVFTSNGTNYNMTLNVSNGSCTKCWKYSNIITNDNNDSLTLGRLNGRSGASSYYGNRTNWRINVERSIDGEPWTVLKTISNSEERHFDDTRVITVSSSYQLGYDYSRLARTSKIKLGFTYFPSTDASSIRFTTVTLESEKYVALYSTLNGDYCGFSPEIDFMNRANTNFLIDNEVALALTVNDSSFDPSTLRILNIFDFNGDLEILYSKPNATLLSNLDVYEDDFFNLTDFASPKDVFIRDDHIFASFNFDSKKFPLLFVSIYTKLLLSDYPSGTTFPVIEVKNVTNYFENNGKNVYGFHLFQEELLLYTITDNFKYGDIYTFEINHTVLRIGSKNKAQDLYFDLQPVEFLAATDIRYVSSEISFSSLSNNYNLNYYLYLFDIGNPNSPIELSGVSFEEKQVPIPGFISRAVKQDTITLDIIGLTPNADHKLLVIPYSNQTDSSAFINKTYDELINTPEVPITEIDFKTNFVPILSTNVPEKVSDELRFSIESYSQDPYAKLKYTYHFAGKTWDRTNLELKAYEGTDEISENFQGGFLSDVSSFSNVNGNNITIRNIYYDEELILLLNFEDVFNNRLLFRNDQPDLGAGSDHLYIPIPFLFDDLFDSGTNYNKQGLGEHFENDTKPNYSDFLDTIDTTTFNSINFLVSNYNFGDIVINKHTSDPFLITYHLSDLLTYKIHMLMLPVSGEPAIDNDFDPNHSNYDVRSIQISDSQSSTRKVSNLSNGRHYSYYIEPVLGSSDRSNGEINQMIWDKLRLPDDPSKDHYQNISELSGFKYFDTSTFSQSDITIDSFNLTLPSTADILNLDPDLSQIQLKSLDFRIQVLDHATNTIHYNVFLDTSSNASTVVHINGLSPSEQYYCAINTSVDSSHMDPMIGPDPSHKLDINTSLEPVDVYGFGFSSYDVVEVDNKVNFTWSFNDPLSTVDFEISRFNFNSGILEPVTVDSIVDDGGFKTVSVVSSYWKDLFSNCYLFHIFNVDNSSRSEPVEFIVGLPDILDVDNNIGIFSINTTTAIININNISSNEFNSPLSYTRLLFNRVAGDIIDSDFDWNPAEIEKDRTILSEVPIYGLKSDSGYKIKAFAKWSNFSLFNTFPDFLESIRSSYLPYEYELDNTNQIEPGVDLKTSAGRLISPFFQRLDSGTNDLDVQFNYTGRHAWARVGIDDGTGEVDINKPYEDFEIKETTGVVSYRTLLIAVPTEEFKIIFEFFEEDDYLYLIPGIELPIYPTITSIPRINVDVVEYRQASTPAGVSDNKFAFLAYAKPFDASFTISCTGLSSGFSPNLRYVIYTEPIFDPDTGKEESVQVIEFTLDDLTYGKDYSLPGSEIKIFASSTNNAIHLSSFPFTLLPFTCKYPMIKGVDQYEANDLVKSEVEFKFYRPKGAFYYQCNLYWKDLDPVSDFSDGPISTEKIRDFSERDYIVYRPNVDIELLSGYYKLEITTLNGDGAPEVIPDEYSTTFLSIMYLKDGVLTPEIKTIKETSDMRPIFTFDFDDPAFDGRGDEIPEYIVMTSDATLGNSSDQTNSFGWYQYDLDEFNSFMSYLPMTPGSNTFYYKTFNRSTERFSDVQFIDVNYNPETGHSLIPDGIYSNSFYGIDRDGSDYNTIDPAREITIDENFNFSKISYIITNEAGKVVSNDDRTIFDSSTRVDKFYIYIDYDGEILDDGIYFINFYIYDKKWEEKKILKTTRLLINNKTLPTPKINYESQAII